MEERRVGGKAQITSPMQNKTCLVHATSPKIPRVNLLHTLDLENLRASIILYKYILVIGRMQFEL